MDRLKRRVLLSATCLISAMAITRASTGLLETELVGGAITGPMLNGSLVAKGLFVLTAILIFIRPRAAAFAALLGSILCLPLYIYRTLPRFFRLVFPGLYKGDMDQTIVLHGWSIVGGCASLIIIGLCWWILATSRRTRFVA